MLSDIRGDVGKPVPVLGGESGERAEYAADRAGGDAFHLCDKALKGDFKSHALDHLPPQVLKVLRVVHSPISREPSPVPTGACRASLSNRAGAASAGAA